MDLNYDACQNFLAKLDAESLESNQLQSPLDDSSLSPYDLRESQSPPGLSSGSATSHSPESVRFDWDPSDPSTLFDDLNDSVGLLADNGEPWDFRSQDQQNQIQVVSPMSDYIKIETGSPEEYFSEGDLQGTISPGNSIINPSLPTSMEDGSGYNFGKGGAAAAAAAAAADQIFDMNSFDAGSSRPPMSTEFSWNNPPLQPLDYSPRSWQRQQQQQQQQRQQQQHQQQPPPQQQQQPQQSSPQQPPTTSQSPPRSSLSPSASHSSPDSRRDSNSDNEAVPRSKKRKTSTDEGTESQQTAPTRKQPKKTAHNMIEKRYRNNLNDKIAALRDSVPSLRIMAGTSKMGDDDEEELDGLAPAHKLNKATVLAKATEYIRHLEKRNKRLQDENEQLKARLSTVEKLATMGGAMGLGHPQGPQPGRGGPGGGPGGGGLMSRMMVGSLAGLMVVNGLRESDNEQGRQLFAIPSVIMDWTGIPGGFAQAQFGNQFFWLIVKIVLLFAAIAYVISPGFFDRKEPRQDAKGSSANADVTAAPSLASPLKDRSHAWLTSIQTVYVPRHSITLELAALGLKACKLSLRRLIGWEKYRMLTGMTEEQEQARIKSWTIALDAQLTGGDISINHSRLLLTLMASFTLPATPARLMLNALHVRILFHDLPKYLQSLAEMVSNHYWIEARKLQDKVIGDKDTSAEGLPENLGQLLQMESGDVLDDLIVGKAYDLAYNRNTSQYVGIDEGFDSVVRDVTIRSPLDALAAWYSSMILHNVSVCSLKRKLSPALQRDIQSDLKIALRTAPPTSAAQLRALVANSILAQDEPEQYLHQALKVFEEDLRTRNESNSSKSTTPTLTVSAINSAVTCTSDIRIAMRCGMALAFMKKGSHNEATRLFGDLDWRRDPASKSENALQLLGFVAVWNTLMTFVQSDEKWATDAGDSVDNAAAMLRRWAGNKRSTKVGLSVPDCNHISEVCKNLQKKLAGLENEDQDDGYVSAEREEVNGPGVHVLHTTAGR